MPVTYESIASTTLSSSQANIDFTNIAGTWTDLVVVATLKSAGAAADVSCRVGNNTFDTGNNYSSTILYGTGSAAGSYAETNASRMLLDYYGSVNNTNDHIAIYHFMNYANTTTHKFVLSRSNRAAAGVDAVAAIWANTSAINQIRFTIDTAGSILLASGSTITLYGIKAA